MLTKLKHFTHHIYEYRVYNPIRYAIDLKRTSYQQFVHKFRTDLRHTKPLRAAIVTDGLGYTSQTQFDPLFAYREALRQQLGFIFKKMFIDTVLDRPNILSKFDVIFIKLFFTTPEGQVQNIIERLHAMKGSAKLIYFDGDDDLCIQWPGIFPYIDLYVKKHIFRNTEEYGKVFMGKNNLSDYVASRWNVAMPRKTQPLSSEQREKIFLGYNVGLDNKIRKLYLNYSSLRHPMPKENDIVYRVSFDPNKRYYSHLRKEALQKLQVMSSQYKVICSTQTVSQRKYYYEMLNSKICVSPFGYGEICWRDFEAILSRCLLIKPDVSHLCTLPDVFQPYESYIPVKWDFSDLEEKCIYYLKHEKEREEITQRAYQALTNYYHPNFFLDKFTEILGKVGLVAN